MPYAVLGAGAQLERDVPREGTVAGMRGAERRGEHIGPRPALSAYFLLQDWSFEPSARRAVGIAAAKARDPRTIPRSRR
jgi:DNA invertase Pin-like site-specific DNA recombinase